MAAEPAPRTREVAEIAADLGAGHQHTDGFGVKDLLQESTEQKVDRIEMLGEEVAGGFRPPEASAISPALRYLHSSRTIHQLVTDRNRAVGLYLAVATLLWTACTALLNVSTKADLILPLDLIQRWCLPFTLAVMTVLAVFVGLLLVRTRVGLIYEVAKMNVLLGLPVGRVSRISPLSIFFLMQLLVSLAGGCSAGLCSAFLLPLLGWQLGLAIPAVLIGMVVGALLMLLYVLTVLRTTSDERLQKVR
jgi:hypothetical protein